MNGDQSRGVRYLLGKLPAGEAEALAEEMFTSDATHDEIEEAESVLTEAYLDGSLSPDDRRRFEELFQSSSVLIERVELARGLRARAVPSRPARRAVPWLPWAAALVLGALGGGAALQANRQATEERDASAARERALSARVSEQEERVRQLEARLVEQPAPAIETWQVGAATQRGEAGAPTFAPARGGWIRLRVSLDAASSALYVARLSLPEGRELFRADGVGAVTEPGGAFADVMVPRGLLPRGTYILTLSRVGRDGPQELGPYAFSVRPR